MNRGPASVTKISVRLDRDFEGPNWRKQASYYRRQSLHVKQRIGQGNRHQRGLQCERSHRGPAARRSGMRLNQVGKHGVFSYERICDPSSLEVKTPETRTEPAVGASFVKNKRPR